MRAEPRATLLPAEFSTRYQQQFYDRLWMRGLLAVPYQELQTELEKHKKHEKKKARKKRAKRTTSERGVSRDSG